MRPVPEQFRYRVSMRKCAYCERPLGLSAHANRRYCSTECRNRANNQTAQQRPVKRGEHGRRIGYARGCRCNLCRSYNAAYSKTVRDRLPRRPRTPRSDKGTKKVAVPHGTRSGYSYHRCRCDECRQGVAAENAIYRAANLDAVRLYHRSYTRANPGKIRKYSLRRQSAPFDSDALAYCAILLNDPCSYCGEPTDSIDHITAVTVSVSSDWTNLTASCKRCNSRKGTKSLMRFLARQRATT